MTRHAPFGMRQSFWAIYLILGVITGWLSFYPRPLDIRVAAEFQQTIWTNLGEQGASAADSHPLMRGHGSRVLFPALMQIPITAGVSIERLFALLRLVTIIGTYLLFHLFLRIWFEDELAFAGTLFVAATVPLTFNNYFEQPTDFPEIIVFTIGIWAMYRRRYSILYMAIAVGTLNRETTAVLPFLFFFALFERHTTAWVKPVLIALACWAAPWVALRLWTVGSLTWPHSGSMAHASEGLVSLFREPHPYNNFLFWFYLFGAFWIVPYVGWASQMRFFRRLLIAVPVVTVLVAVAGGYVNEPRLLVMLYPILVPAGLFALFPSSASRKPPRAGEALG